MGLMDKVKGVMFDDGGDKFPRMSETTGNIGTSYGRVVIDAPDVNVSVDTSLVLSANDVFAAAGLSDKEKSIYKVNEIKGTLPTTLPKEQLKTTTIAMMGVAKLTVEEVSADADKRTEALLQGLEQFTLETKHIVSTSQQDIADLEAQIEEKKQLIAARNADQENVEKNMTTELDVIKVARDFINV